MKNPRASASCAGWRAFTLIELLGVIASSALLGALLLPALASAKAKALQMRCGSNQRQLMLGLNLFPTDNGETYPAAGWQYPAGSAPVYQISWDSWINNYIGGHTAQVDLQQGYLLNGDLPTVLFCPADKFPKVQWMGGTAPYFAQRTYAMNAAGPVWGSQYQVDDQNRKYPLPKIQNGVGIYWVDSINSPDWAARGYKTSVVKDPSGTIMLAENTHGQQCAGNIWTCVCLGPYFSGNNDLYQIDSNGAPQDPNAATSVNQGALLYKAHRNRFNYAFTDGHVETLKWEQTIGTGTKTAPNGMWTMTPGD